MRLAIIGAGAVGARVAALMAGTDATEVTLIDRRRAAVVARSLGAAARPAARLDGSFDAVVVATPWGTHVDMASMALAHAPVVISVGDSIEDVRGLLGLGPQARERGGQIVVGAGFAPGYTDVLARHLASRCDTTDEIHVTKVGTGGPWCARQHHRALGGTGVDYRHGAWVPRAGGSGRELAWFPDPIGGRDCYRAALSDPILLVPLFDGVQRVTARMAATRRDRLTGRLPMLRPPHPDGGPGAVRVEVRAWNGRERVVAVAAAVAAPSEAAAAMAVTVVGSLESRAVTEPGCWSVGALVEPAPTLAAMRRLGVVAEELVGAT